MFFWGEGGGGEESYEKYLGKRTDIWINGANQNLIKRKREYHYMNYFQYL